MLGTGTGITGTEWDGAAVSESRVSLRELYGTIAAERVPWHIKLVSWRNLLFLHGPLRIPQILHNGHR